MLFFCSVLEEKKRNDRNNWVSKILVTRNQFLYREIGGIYNLKITVENQTQYMLDEVTVAVDYVKTDLMPDFDFDSYNHEYTETAPVLDGTVVETMTTIETIDDIAGSETAPDEVDKW